MSTVTAADILVRAAARVRRGWTQEANAVDSNGMVVSPTSEQAIAWCAIGAISAESAVAGHGYVSAVFGLLEEFLATRIAEWNDSEGMDANTVALTLERCAAASRGL